MPARSNPAPYACALRRAESDAAGEAPGDATGGAAPGAGGRDGGVTASAGPIAHSVSLRQPAGRRDGRHTRYASARRDTCDPEGEGTGNAGTRYERENATPRAAGQSPGAGGRPRGARGGRKVRAIPCGKDRGDRCGDQRAAASIIPATMWMLRALPTMSWFAAHGYYRVTQGGVEPPRSGPELIVANHTNSLLDVAFVVVASRRRVRFMTKAPLFTYPGLGWLVKAVGSVPVYRRQEDPPLVAQNFDVFRDVYRAIAQGYAVGIFPEGISHSASRLQPLKTGAARIALGAAEQLEGRAFPIVPIGMVFRDRRTFRSQAHVIVGEPCVWDDLAGRGPGDREAVRELTRRIEASMRA